MYGTLFLSRAYFWYRQHERYEPKQKREAVKQPTKPLILLCVQHGYYSRNKVIYLHFFFSPCDLKIDLIIHISSIVNGCRLCATNTGLKWWWCFTKEEETENRMKCVRKKKKKSGSFIRKLCVILSWACDRFWYESSARERPKLTAIQMRARRYLNFLSQPTYFTRSSVCSNLRAKLCAYSRRMWIIRVMIKRDLEKFLDHFSATTTVASRNGMTNNENWNHEKLLA